MSVRMKQDISRVWIDERECDGESRKEALDRARNPVLRAICGHEEPPFSTTSLFSSVQILTSIPTLRPTGLLFPLLTLASQFCQRKHGASRERQGEAELVVQLSSDVTGIVDWQADLSAQLEAAGNKLVVIDFYATWCGPCKMIAPAIERMEKEMKDSVVFLKVDVDETDDIAAEYKIEAMPTFIFIKNKEVKEKFSGASEAKITDLIKQFK